MYVTNMPQNKELVNNRARFKTQGCWIAKSVTSPLCHASCQEHLKQGCRMRTDVHSCLEAKLCLSSVPFSFFTSQRSYVLGVCQIIFLSVT